MNIYNFAEKIMMRTRILLMVVSLFVIAACNNQDNTEVSSNEVLNPNTASGNADMSLLPKFEFKDEEHDFGKLGQGEKVSYTFKFKNTGKADLVIMDAKATCGCTVADYPKTPVKPGAESWIQITFNTEGKKGIQNKTITIVANTQPNTKVLTIKAEITVPINN